MVRRNWSGKNEDMLMHIEKKITLVANNGQSLHKPQQPK
jgi:hypothetical protein